MGYGLCLFCFFVHVKSTLEVLVALLIFSSILMRIEGVWANSQHTHTHICFIRAIIRRNLLEIVRMFHLVQGLATTLHRSDRYAL